MPTPSWLGSIKQTAFVTHDIEATAQEWVDIHGIGPWFIYTVDIPDTKYGEQLIPLKARMALAQSGSQQIELIEHQKIPLSIQNSLTQEKRASTIFVTGPTLMTPEHTSTQLDMKKPNMG